MAKHRQRPQYRNTELRSSALQVISIQQLIPRRKVRGELYVAVHYGKNVRLKKRSDILRLAVEVILSKFEGKPNRAQRMFAERVAGMVWDQLNQIYQFRPRPPRCAAR